MSTVNSLAARGVIPALATAPLTPPLEIGITKLRTVSPGRAPVVRLAVTPGGSDVAGGVGKRLAGPVSVMIIAETPELVAGAGMAVRPAESGLAVPVPANVDPIPAGVRCTPASCTPGCDRRKP